MKLRTRLGLSFGVAIALLLVVCAVAWSAMRTMKSNFDDVVRNNVVMALHAGDALTATLRMGLDTRDMVQLSDDAALQATDAAYEQHRQGYESAVAQLGAMDLDPTEASLLASIRSAGVEAIAHGAQAMRLALHDRQGEAATLVRSTVSPEQARLATVLIAFVDYEKSQDVDGSAQATQAYRSSLRDMGALIAVSALVFGALAAWSTRSVLTRLGAEPSELATMVHAVAAGDLTLSIEVAAGDTRSVLAALHGMVARLGATLGSIRDAGLELTNASSEIAGTSHGLAQSASKQAASVDQMSAALEQFGASIQGGADHARQTASLSARAVAQAREGRAAAEQTATDMQAIAERVGVIDDIAYQTNMLALNAAIEAARAGQQGRGFAVVAAEVRKLAEHSQRASTEIDALAQGTVREARRAGDLLGSIVDAIERTSQLMAQIEAAADEQSTGVGQINGAMGQINVATQHNASASEQLAATAQSMREHAQGLQRCVGLFRLAPTQAPRG